MDVFTDEESETFIYLISEHPLLFNYKNHNYKDPRVKEIIWKEIAQELNKTSESCKKQWKTIRDGYMRFKRKNKLPTGSEAPKSNRTKWKLYRLLSFLDNIPLERSSVGSGDDESVSSQKRAEGPTESIQNNIQQGTDDTLSETNTQGNARINSEQNLSPPSMPVSPHKRIKKRPRSGTDDIFPYMKETENIRLLKNMSETDDEFKSFGNHIEHVLKNLPTKLLQIKAKREIFEVLTKYELQAADNNLSPQLTVPNKLI